MSDRMKSRAALIAAFTFAAAAAFAASPDDDGSSEWTTFVPPAASTSTAPNSPIGPTTAEGGFSAPDRVIFGEQMRARVLDQLCRNIKLTVNYNLPDDFNGTGTGMQRYLAPLPDGRLTIVDEETLRVGYGHGFTKALDGDSGLTAGLWIGSKLEGSSMVIRPLQEKQTCKEIGELADLRDIKTVLPFKGERVADMKVGELWRLPFTLTVGHTESLGDAVSDKLNISLSFNDSESGAATLTLFRLSDSQLRFRFRIDRVEVRTRGANVVETIPAIAFPSLGANILLKFVDREIANQLSRYTLATLGLADARSEGKRVVLEYIVDPRVPEQAEAVAKALHGDFRSLVKMGWDLGTRQATDASTQEAYRRLEAEHDAELGPASFAAISAYTQRAKSFTLKLPFITSQNWSHLTGDETVTRYTDVQGQLHFDRADKSRVSEYIDIPVMGPLVKDNSQRDVQVVTAAKKGDAYGDPIVIYLQQHGFLRATESSVREKAMQFSEIMALAGTRGNGTDPKMAVPLAKAFPEPPSPVYDQRGERTNTENANRKGTIAFTLVFNQEAVKQLTHASVDDIVRSYAATVDSIPAMQWLMANGHYDAAKGEYAYDWRAARKAFPDREDDRRGRSYEEGEIEHMAKQAAGLISDLAAARDAFDNESRSAALAKAFGGQGASGLGYDQALRVFVQLVDPMNLTGDFVAAENRSKDEGGNLALHLILKKNRPENQLLNLAGEARARFATPSILTD